MNPSERHRDVITSQTRSRERVRALAEVFTNEREVNAMLDSVPDMFPSASRPRDIGCTFLEPACGAGNFLVAILDRKLAFVTYGPIYRSNATLEAAVLKALASIYGIDIDAENVEQSRHFLRADIAHHMNLHMNTFMPTEGFWGAVDVILKTNIIQADTLKDSKEIRFVEYVWQRKTGFLIRKWSFFEEPEDQLDLFEAFAEGASNDSEAIHYSQLADYPKPT